MLKRGILAKKKYFGRLLIWLTAVISLIVIVFTITTYLIAHQIFMKNEFETSNKILNQLKFNIEFIDKTIKASSKSLFLNPGVSYIMNSSQGSIEMSELYSKLIGTTSSVMMANNYIHSICVYNSVNEQYYYTGKSLYFDDKELKELIEDYPNIPKQKPILRKIAYEYGKKQEYENVLTYIMYETTGPLKKIDSALIINARPEWILDNISAIDTKNSGNRIFVMDDKGQFLNSTENSLETERALLDEYTKHKNSGGDIPDHFICKIMNQEYIVTYNEIKDIGFTLFRIRPAKEVYKYVDMLRISNLAAAAIVLLLSVLVSIIVSNKLYKPIGTLVKHVSASGNSEFHLNQPDEISYLNNVYKYSMEKIEKYDNEKIKYRGIMKTYWLKKLLTDTEKIEREQYETICRENMINIPYDYNYYVCLLKIDNFKEFQRINSIKDRKLIRFAIINITTEVLSKDFASEGVDMNEEHVAFIIGVNPDSGEKVDKVIECIMKAQECIHKYFDISVTASISEKIDNLWMIPEGYQEALENSLYRFVLGRRSVITVERIQQNCTNKIRSYSKESEKKLIDSIKLAKIKEIEEELKIIINEISLLSYDNITVSIIKLLDAVKSSLLTFSETLNFSIKSGFLDIRHIIYDIETIDELYQMLLETIKDGINAQLEKESNAKYGIIAEAAVGIINKNYWDISLCTNEIASLMKINPRYLARAFKDIIGMSIPNYINNVRLKKAAELLGSDPDVNVYDVIEEVGFDNESYFYRMFKMKYGCTPKEYALQKSLAENV
ncbi:MAG TPA: helix-turn-helix transcriptional regulator [Clostridiaceae bacterium]|nr:helix-turn-helix transcriptional regulator [Clostridiaceae bacterium]